MRRYETFVIIDPDVSQEQRDLLRDRVRELITQMDGMLVFEDDWGDRKLAYEIRKKQRGYYVRFDYCGGAELVNEIERFFRIDDRSLKYMTVLLDRDADLEKIKEEKAAADSKRELEREAAEKQAREDAAASSAQDAAGEVKEAAAAVAQEATPEAAQSTPEATPEAAQSTPEAAPEAAQSTPETAPEEAQSTPEAAASDADASVEGTTPQEKKEEA
jgi:small subunit ribosomal protein S6